MSLLMQALKKAERAKQSHHADEEPGKPSEAFDSVLELAPQEPLMSQPEPVPAPESLSLSPLDAAPREPALEFVPPEAPRAEERPGPPPPPQSRRPRNPPQQPQQPRARARPRATPVLSARTIRMAALGAGALVVGSVLGYMYWHEMYGPGSSRHLPPVPMPGQNLPPPSAHDAAGPSLLGSAVLGSLPPAPASIPVPAAPGAPELPPAGVASAAPAVQATGPGSSRGDPPPDAYMGPAATGPGSSREQPPPESYTSQPPAAPPARSAAVAVTSEPGDIRVARASNPERISPGIAAGYGAYQRGDLPAARAAYQDALRQDPHSRDALLGLAAVALRAGELEQAGAHYARLLEMDPHDAHALAGMAQLRGADSASERRLRQAVEKHPDAGPALFALGNLYAREKRWQEAQQYYFRAYTSTPQNADYAFNLAVGLDRLNQSRLALTYYQRALELAGDAQVGFDRAAAGQRMRELGGR